MSFSVAIKNGLCVNRKSCFEKNPPCYEYYNYVYECPFVTPTFVTSIH